MVPCLDFRIGLANLAVSTDQIADPVGLAGPRISGRTVGNGNGKIFVADKIKGERILVVKLLVLGRWVIADTNDHRIVVSQLLDSITEPLTLAGSARGTGPRIEPENHVLTRVVTQGNRLAILIGQAE